MMRILIADDHAIVRRGLREILLDKYPSVEIGEAADTDELIKKTIHEKWDIVISDLIMPGRNALDALKQIKQEQPKLPVLIMSMYPEEEYAIRALKAGASGYFSKNSIHKELFKAIETVRLGKRYITPNVAEKLMETINGKSDVPLHELLSDREFEVFKQLADGKKISEIASELSLSPNTISTHRARILEKLKLKTNADLIKYALNKNLV